MATRYSQYGVKYTEIGGTRYTLKTCLPVNRAVYRIFAKGGRTWSMSKRGGARLFVAAGQPQGGGCRRGMCPLPHNIDIILS